VPAVAKTRNKAKKSHTELNDLLGLECESRTSLEINEMQQFMKTVAGSAKAMTNQGMSINRCSRKKPMTANMYSQKPSVHKSPVTVQPST
jgi:hypothetical protein